MGKKRGSKTSASAANWLWESQSHSQTLCSDSFSSERFQEQIGFENGKNVAPAQKEQSGASEEVKSLNVAAISLHNGKHQ